MYSVVIVEDSHLLRQGMVLTFDWDALSCRVVGDAESGLEGLAMIEKTQPDIVITDIRIPDLNGLEMIRNLREAGNTSVFILISAYNEFAYAQKAIRYNVSEFLVKPFENDELVHAVVRAAKQVDAQRNVEFLSGRIKGLEADKAVLYDGYVADDGDFKSRYVQAAIEYISENYQKNIGVGDIALALSISESYLSKVFKQGKGIPVGEYLINVRIAQACRLLSQVDMRVHEIAEAVGYTDQRYFSVVFKRVTGLTPNEFRKKHRTR